jgi:RNA recognition motif-containing protein
MVYDQGVFRGVAFGECSNAAQYQAALRLHQSKHTLKGRRINVRPTKSKQELGDIVKRREELVAAKVALLRQRQKDKKKNVSSVTTKAKKKKGRVYMKKSSVKTQHSPAAASSSPVQETTGSKKTGKEKDSTLKASTSQI